MSEIIDLNKWLRDRGINTDWVAMVVPKIQQNYPALTAALRGHKDVTAELELMKLIRDIEDRAFYLHEPGCYACAVGDLHTAHHPETEAEHKRKA